MQNARWINGDRSNASGFVINATMEGFVMTKQASAYARMDLKDRTV